RREAIEPRVDEVLRATFRPEFLNRIDEIVIFKSLEPAALSAIVRIQAARLKQLLAERQIGLELTEAAAELLAREGYDRDFGARPLKRVLQKRVQDPLAVRLLEGAFEPGDTVVVDAAPDGGMVFTRKALAREAASPAHPVP
ncbi:MAG TPA: type VI secretion system ATPase TssH, partial [Candidatus Polarisedimenticolia bacterium]|nr:type VI secretion system ATPase TssH [Candidatus Polarisedimenticolia bacterium]